MFFTRDRFFRGLRLVLALDPNKVAIGEVVVDAIEKEYLPQLVDQFEREPDEGRRAEIQNLIDLWSDYANRMAPQGRSWNSEATKVIVNVGNKVGKSEAQKEELAQAVAVRFYTRPKLKRFIENYDPARGPIGLMKAFKRAVGQEALHLVRLERGERVDPETGERTFTRKTVPLQTDEGGLIETLGDPRETELTRREIKETRREMAKWVRRRLTAEPARVLFDMWQKTAEDKGPDNVNFSRDIYPAWNEETGKSSSLMDKYWKKIKGLIVEYLEEEEGIRLGPRTLKKLKVSQRVARGFWRRRFATWMLEVVRVRRAASDPFGRAIGEVVIDVLERHHLPYLRSDDGLSMTRRDNPRLEDDELLEVWEDYGRHGGKSHIWGDEGMKVVRKIGRKHGLTESRIRELATDVAGRFFLHPRSMRPIVDYHPKSGPKGLVGLFKRLVWMTAATLIRQMPDEPVEDNTEEGVRVDFGNRKIIEMKRDLSRWMLKRLNKEQSILFQIWMDEIGEHGGDVNFSKKVYPKFHLETGMASYTMDRYWKKIKKLVMTYFRDELGIVPSKRVLKKMKVFTKGRSAGILEDDLLRMFLSFVEGG